MFEKNYSFNQDLRDYLGSWEQLGSLQLLQKLDGPGRGCRVLQFYTGGGLEFQVEVERGMDVSQLRYQGIPFGWIPSTQLPAPWFFEQQTEFGWLRTAMGGFQNSCGLLHIGDPETGSIENYAFPARSEEHYGVHDRLAMTPAKLERHQTVWREGEAYLEAEGKLIQSQVYGENLTLRRTFQAKFGANCFKLNDEVTNEGYYATPHMFLYHFNFGFPIVSPSSRVLLPLSSPPQFLSGTETAATKDNYLNCAPPDVGAEFEVFAHSLCFDASGWTMVGVFNPDLLDNGLGVYLRFNKEQFPCFLQTRLMRKGHYLISLEPSTNLFGRAANWENGKMITLNPGESRNYEIEVGILDSREKFDNFLSNLEGLWV